MCLWAINKIDVTVSTERFGHNSLGYKLKVENRSKVSILSRQYRSDTSTGTDAIFRYLHEILSMLASCC